MDSKIFHLCYDLFRERDLPSGIVIPPVCCNHVCGNWSSPSYCFEIKQICVRSIVMYNLPLLPLPKKEPVQLNLFE